MVVAGGLARAQVAAARGDHEGVLRALEPVVGLRVAGGGGRAGVLAVAGDVRGCVGECGAVGGGGGVPGAARGVGRGAGAAVGCGDAGPGAGAVGGGAGRGGRRRRRSAGVGGVGGLSVPFPRALLELAFGQVLRRHGQRRAAVEQLQAARDRFAGLGARPYVERCERELGASGLAPGEAARRRSGPVDRAGVGGGAVGGAGLSNRQVASELFVSVKTVQFHLTRIYAKLGVSSRAELAARSAARPMPMPMRAGSPAAHTLDCSITVIRNAAGWALDQRSCADCSAMPAASPMTVQDTPAALGPRRRPRRGRPVSASPAG